MVVVQNNQLLDKEGAFKDGIFDETYDGNCGDNAGPSQTQLLEEFF